VAPLSGGLEMRITEKVAGASTGRIPLPLWMRYSVVGQM